MNYPNGLQLNLMDTGYGNHLIGIYAVYSVKVDGISVIRRALLALEPLIDDTDQKAESFRDTILTYLEEYYGIIIDNIACVVADAAQVNDDTYSAATSILADGT